MTLSRRRLLLLRHAKAVTAFADMSDATDHARGLSGRGKHDAAAMGQLIRERGLTPECVLISTALRTRETFDLLGPFEGNGPRQVLSPGLYLGEAASLLEVVREQGGSSESVMLIGHNPGIHELALQLAPDGAEVKWSFPTCTLALFDVEGEWTDLGPGRAVLREVLQP